MTVKRNPTRAVRVGTAWLGAAHPVAVQSMCATRTQDIDATVEQAEAIRSAGGDLVRVAVDSAKDVEALAEIRRQTTRQPRGRPAGELPPGRAGGARTSTRSATTPATSTTTSRRSRCAEKVRFLADVAREHDCAIRVGVNCGSVDPEHQGPPSRGRRRGHGGVGARALRAARRPRLRPLRGQPQGLAPAQGHRGQHALRRRCAPTCRCTWA